MQPSVEYGCIPTECCFCGIIFLPSWNAYGIRINLFARGGNFVSLLFNSISPKGLIFITVGKRSVACGKIKEILATAWKAEQSKDRVLPFRQFYERLRSTAGNATLAYGYENQAFQATNKLLFNSWFTLKIGKFASFCVICVQKSSRK